MCLAYSYICLLLIVYTSSGVDMILTEVPVGLDVGVKNVRIDRFVKQAVPGLDAIAQRGPEFCKLVSLLSSYHYILQAFQLNRHVHPSVDSPSHEVCRSRRGQSATRR